MYAEQSGSQRTFIIPHRIAEALAGAGIVIAFPQRDVHIEALSPIAVKIVPPGP